MGTLDEIMRPGGRQAPLSVIHPTDTKIAPLWHGKGGSSRCSFLHDSSYYFRIKKKKKYGEQQHSRHTYFCCCRCWSESHSQPTASFSRYDSKDAIRLWKTTDWRSLPRREACPQAYCCCCWGRDQSW